MMTGPHRADKRVASAKRPFYAVRVGRAPGLFDSWRDCKESVGGFAGACYQKFSDKAAALAFLYGTDEARERIAEEVRFAARSDRQETEQEPVPPADVLHAWLGTAPETGRAAFVFDPPSVKSFVVTYDWDRPATDTRCFLKAMLALSSRLRGPRPETGAAPGTLTVYVHLRSKYALDALNRNLAIWAKQGWKNARIRDGDADLYKMLHDQLRARGHQTRMIGCSCSSRGPNDSRYVVLRSADAAALALSG